MGRLVSVMANGSDRDAVAAARVLLAEARSWRDAAWVDARVDALEADLRGAAASGLAMSAAKFRVRALARMAGGLDPGGGSLMLEHLIDCLDAAGSTPAPCALPPARLPCAGDDRRDGCPVAFRGHLRALRWVVAMGEAADDGDPTESHPGPPPGCYPLFARHRTPSPLGRRR